MRIPPLAALVLGAFLALGGLLAACSSEPAEEFAGDPPTVPPAAPTPPSTPELVPAVAPTGVAPFDAVLLELFGTTDTDAYLAGLDELAGELSIACMEEAGFELQITTPPRFEEPAESDLVAAQELGFGIIEGFRFRIAQQQQALPPDPNLPYLATLSSDEIQRFFETLDGVPAAAGQEQVDVGCNGFAATQARVEWDRFSMTLPNYTVLGEEIDTNARWIAARATWQECMAEQGLPYTDPAAIRSDVRTRMRDEVAAAFPDGQIPLVIVEGALGFDPEADRLLDELQTFEQNAAVASIECTEPLMAEFAAAEFEVQQAFVDRNQAAIDELLSR